MSVTNAFFFNYPKALADLGTEINACLGCSLAPYEGNPENLFDYFMGMEFSLHSAEGYEEREVPGYGGRLYDVISGTPFVDFAQHLEILRRRLPEVR